MKSGRNPLPANARAKMDNLAPPLPALFQTLATAAAIFAGGAVGSFLCVCVRRVPRGISVISPPSACETCGKPVPFYLNIPVVGFLFCAGRCRDCGEKIPLLYPALETLCALAAFAAVKWGGFSLDGLECFIFLYALIAASAFDLTTMTVPDFITVPFAVAGIALSIPADSFTRAVSGGAVGGGVLLAAALAYRAVRKRDGMGMGDVKLMTGAGVFTGAEGALLVIFAASALGAAGGFVYLKKRGESFSRPFPFAPFIAASAVFFFFAS